MGLFELANEMFKGSRKLTEVEADALEKTFIDSLRKEPNSVSSCCPVCGGNGLVPNGFYLQTGGQWSTSDATPEKCRSCNGTGVVWNINPHI